MFRLTVATLALFLSAPALACGMYVPHDVMLTDLFDEIDEPGEIFLLEPEISVASVDWEPNPAVLDYPIAVDDAGAPVRLDVEPNS